MPLLQRLKGMEDRTGLRLRAIAGVTEALSRFLARYGYRPMDTPLLEETELFLRKSGGELAGKMYSFTDPGGHRVSLRPEFTASVVRAMLEQGGEGEVMRSRYAGPVFRYETDQGSSHRQFTQVGAELFGASGPWADAEVLAMAWKGPASLGLRDHWLVLGHVGFVSALLESFELSDRARVFLLAQVGVLSRGSQGMEEVRQRVRSLGLLGEGDEARGTESPPRGSLEFALQGWPAPTFGVRTAEEIQERFWRKQRLAQGSGRVQEALELLARVAQVRGAVGNALETVRALVPSDAARKELDHLQATVEALSHYDIASRVSLDFGLARGIAYYTGIIFELRHESLGDSSLGGGGRYDGLVQALRITPSSGQDLPAMGFAWTGESLIHALDHEQQAVGPEEEQTLLVRPEGPSARASAVREAERLRQQGKAVEVDLSGRSLSQCLEDARRRGLQQLFSVDVRGGVKPRNVAKR